MRLTLTTACLILLNAAATAGPAKTSTDELLCDYSSDLLAHAIGLRANGYSQGSAAQSAGAFAGQWFTKQSFDDPASAKEIGRISTMMIQWVYSQPRQNVEHDASLGDLSLQIYDGCMKSWF